MCPKKKWLKTANSLNGGSWVGTNLFSFSINDNFRVTSVILARKIWQASLRQFSTYHYFHTNVWIDWSNMWFLQCIFQRSYTAVCAYGQFYCLIQNTHVRTSEFIFRDSVWVSIMYYFKNKLKNVKREKLAQSFYLTCVLFNITKECL